MTGNGSRSVLSSIVRGLLLAWAAFWTFFAISVRAMSGEGLSIHVVSFVLALLILAFSGWRWPRFGGLALIAAGVVAMGFFRDGYAAGLLAAPAIVLGVALTLERPNPTENGPGD